MASASQSIKQQLRDYLTAEQPPAITESVWQNLLQRLAPVSESYVRELLRATGLPFDQPYAGIRQHTLEELEESLRQMQRVYTEALSAGNRERACYCRRQVIGAKDRARYLARSRVASILDAAMKYRQQPGFFDERLCGINCASGFIRIETDGTPELFPHARQWRQRHVVRGQWPIKENPEVFAAWVDARKRLLANTG